MQLDLFNKDAEREQEKAKELLYAYYARMNKREFVSAITTYNLNLAFYKGRSSEKMLNEILDKYNHLKKQIEAQLADKDQAPIKGRASSRHQQWKYFRIFCMNQLHMDNGNTHKLRIIAQENDKNCESPF